MFKTIQNLTQRLAEITARIPLWLHAILVIVAFGLYMGTNTILDASYAASQFPVPFYVGQTAFDGEQIKAWYAVMIEKETLGIYWRTQVYRL